MMNEMNLKDTPNDDDNKCDQLATNGDDELSGSISSDTLLG